MPPGFPMPGIGTDAHSGATVADFNRVPVSISRSSTAPEPLSWVLPSQRTKPLLPQPPTFRKQKIKSPTFFRSPSRQSPFPAILRTPALGISRRAAPAFPPTNSQFAVRLLSQADCKTRTQGPERLPLQNTRTPFSGPRCRLPLLELGQCRNNGNQHKVGAIYGRMVVRPPD
jgi:hypothetical protein